MPGTTNGQTPTAESCLRRAAALLDRAERVDTPGGRTALVELAAGWRELGMAAGYLESTRNA